MNKHERAGGEAVVEYLDSNLRLIKPGAYVRCAVTGQAIPLDQLKYWSVERQEAYSGPEAVLKRLGVKPPRDAAGLPRPNPTADSAGVEDTR